MFYLLRLAIGVPAGLALVASGTLPAVVTATDTGLVVLFGAVCRWVSRRRRSG